MSPEEQSPPTPLDLLDALDSRVDELAHRCFEIFARDIPSALQWSAEQRDAFVDQAKGRFGALLAVVEHGAEVDEALRGDLEKVGGSAAQQGASLPHLLLVLRISRDLLARTAQQLAAQKKGAWDIIVGGFIGRLLPSVDRLNDAVSNGYWSSKLEDSHSDWRRLGDLLEKTPYGVYECDLDGIVQYANPALSFLVGRKGENLAGLALNEVFVVESEGSAVSTLFAEHPEDVGQVSFTVRGGDGEEHPLDIDMVVRRDGDSVAGFAGIVRRASVPVVLEPEPEPEIDFTIVVRHLEELRRSLGILAEAGDSLKARANELRPDQIQTAGESLHRQADRMQLIVTELDSDRHNLLPPS